MKYSDACITRLREIKKHYFESQKDDWVKTFEESYNKEWNRKFFIPILNLLQSNNKDVQIFWNALHEWYIENTPNRFSPYDPIIILNILKSLEKDSSKNGIKNLKAFKNLVINEGLLENQQIGLVKNIESSYFGPGFDIVNISKSIYIANYKELILRLVLHAFGLLRKEDILADPSKQVSFENLNYLAKHKLTKRVSRKKYDEHLSYLTEISKEGNDYFMFDHLQPDYKLLIDISWLPNNKNHIQFLHNFLYGEYMKGISHLPWEKANAYIDALVYLVELVKARSRILVKNGGNEPNISLQELALVTNTKNLKTIRNEFFKEENLLEYSNVEKDRVTLESAKKWVKDSKRKQPLFDFLLGKDNYLVNFKIKDLQKL